MTASEERAVRLRPLRGHAGDARAVYRAEDAALVVGPQGLVASGDVRQSIGSLTLMFAGPERQLVGFDAHTWHGRWQREPIRVPEATEAPLASTALFDETGIAAGPLHDVEWRVDEDLRTLAGIVADAPARDAYRCLACAVFELDEQGELVRIYLDDVDLEGL